jgi:FkbH-like protein
MGIAARRLDLPQRWWFSMLLRAARRDELNRGQDTTSMASGGVMNFRISDGSEGAGKPATHLDEYLTPRSLGPRLEGLRYLLLGACQVGFFTVFAPEVGCVADHMLYDSASFTPVPEIDTANYDALIVGFTFRHIISEAAGGAFELEYFRAPDPAEAEATLRRCIEIVEDRVDRLHQRFKSLPTFFLSFQEPSFNYFGNLADRYAPTSPRGFVRALNAALEACLKRRVNFHMLDVNEAMSAVGAARLHDDITTSFSHASILGDFDATHDGERLVVSAHLAKVLDSDVQLRPFAKLLLSTVADNLKIIRQIDSVKLIIVDLDDTLWRGVAAEDALDKWTRVEGWPVGFVEALLIFKRRGGLLAISSKNDHDATIARLSNIWAGRITPADFVSIKINWSPKSDSIGEILSETNILARNAIFIDDNPREIDEVKARHPEIRCVGGSHYDWRRIILRSPETQTPQVSAESERRTELVKARIDREAQANETPREEWLKSLQIEEDVSLVRETSHPLFARSMELLNKTNQFNTTGVRWGIGELDAFFSAGGTCLAASLRDKTIDNGVIGIALVRPGEIVQVVLSCRVFGLGAETALGHVATEIALKGSPEVRARVVDTGRNFACHGFFASMGFDRRDDEFIARISCPAPEWIRLSVRDETLSVA